ncbi:unnamed protein product [Blepharisma stoltei]|uniref:Uncharacterized protein n=1 Tax=Blepharisma stoltei TaxID=1481888 RepID=A0AAU9JVA3_9CILI|nr:unnamed protein product [Blepharisma stoltei]
MRRMFSSLYPYHTIEKSKAQKLIDFPLQFYSENFPKKEQEPIPSISYNDEIAETLEGATYGCGTFLSLLAEENFKDLEDLVEWNMFKALEKSIKSYKDQGYTITSIGSTENSKAEILDFNMYVGCLLPYRNLNLEVSQYEIFSEENKEPLPKVHEYKIKTEEDWSYSDLPDFLEFESLNLKEISRGGNIELYKRRIERLGRLLNFNPITMHVIDIGYTSTFKLLVKDKEGKIIEGTNDENKQEFHSFRMESVIYEENLFEKLFDPSHSLQNFLNEKFPGLLNQFTISDVDGLMNGNPFTT